MSNEEIRKALQHIAEYWNRDQNEAAMVDALYHIIETAEQTLAEPAESAAHCYLNEHGNDKLAKAGVLDSNVVAPSCTPHDWNTELLRIHPDGEITFYWERISQEAEKPMSANGTMVGWCKALMKLKRQVEPTAQEPVHFRAVICKEQQEQALGVVPKIVGFVDKKAAEQFILEKRDFQGWRYNLEPLYTEAPAVAHPPAEVVRELYETLMAAEFILSELGMGAACEMCNATLNKAKEHGL